LSTTTDAGTLIVGASHAGVALALSLRELGVLTPITLVGGEPHPPYQRPPLSKAYLHGEADLEALALRPHGYLQDRAIAVHTGAQVDRVTLSGAGPGGQATAASGDTFEFERLALTVGARPRKLSVPGADLAGVVYLRGVDDAEALRARLDDAESVVVIGGGFIGLEAAAAARSQGKTVTVLEAGPRLIARAVAPVVSEFYEAAHRRRGVDVRLDVTVEALSGPDGRVGVVHLSDGTDLPADLVVVGIGVEPRTELAEQLGLECHGGIVVDSFARTSNPSIVAAGDCTVQPSPLTGSGRVRIESVQNAASQAKVAAATLAGRLEPHSAVPWFWSDQFDLKLQIAGISTGYDRFAVRGDRGGEAFSVLYYRGAELLAVDAVNAGPDYMAVRKALTRGATIPFEAASDPTTALRDEIVVQVAS
jgi:3-phenylpropionate/trans-cinnamate dioxygenase ferredoxin reductase subunit